MKTNFTRIKGITFKLLCAVGAIVGGLVSSPSFSQISLISDIKPGTSGSSPQYLATFKGKLMFRADDGNTGTELWSYDYLTNETKLVQDINASFGSSAKYFYEWNNELYFNASEGSNGYELWKYDGDTCVMVVDIRPGTSGSSPNNFMEYKGNLYFTANDGTNGTEVWTYDGTVASIVQDIRPGSSSASPSNLYVHNDTLFFRANDGTNGTELWKFDGTVASMVQDLRSGSSSSSPNYLATYNGDLYFSANDGTTGSELYKYNGTGISLVADIRVGTSSGSPGYLTSFGGDLIFKANDGTNGTELWKYDGVSASMIVDLDPRTNKSGSPQYFIEYKSELYFQGRDSLYGSELRKYDGTTVSLVHDYYPGEMSPGNANGTGPAKFAVYNDGLYFQGWKGDHGAELLRFMICTEPDAPVIVSDTVNICSGDSAFAVDPSAMLNNATSWGLYTGSCGGNLETNSYDGEFDIISTGWYFVRAEGGCSTPSVCDSIYVNADANASINSAGPLCIDASVETLAAATVGGAFSGLGVTGDDFDASVAGAGSHMVYYTVSENSCTNVDSLEIVINALPDASITSLIPLCPDGAVETLIGATAGGTFSGNGVTGNSFDPTVPGMGTFTVYYVVTDMNGCTNNDSTEVFIGTPDATITPVGPLCNDGSVVLLESASAGGLFSGLATTGDYFVPQVAKAGTHWVYYVVTDTNNCTNSDSLEIVVDACVSIEELSNSLSLSVYPNPSNGVFVLDLNTVSNSPVVIEIYNTVGTRVFTKEFRKTQRQTISLDEITSGVYIVKATSMGQFFESRLIIE